MYAFETQQLVKQYGNTLALDGLNMRVPAQSVYGLLGINGAGKTTTFGIAGGFIHPTSGSVQVQGRLGILPQDARFTHGRTVHSQLRFLGLLSGVPRGTLDQEIERVLGIVGLLEKRTVPTQQLSHGMYKRLGIAQALLGNPDVLLLDEPTAGLDPEHAFEIRQLIKTLGQQKTLVVSSHNLHEIAELCTMVGIIHEGRMLFEGRMQELQKSSSKVQYLLHRPDQEVLNSILGEFGWIEEFRMDDLGILHVFFSEQDISVLEVNRQLLGALMDASVDIQEIRVGRSLEETFLEMIGRGS